jgi:adenosylcobinamide-phosphate synthase
MPTTGCASACPEAPAHSIGWIARLAEPVAITALVLEAAIGWPAPLYRAIGHPVGLFARAIDGAERRWNRGSDRRRRAAGIALIVLLVVATISVCWAIRQAAGSVAGRWSWLIVALVAVPGLAQRSLHDHVAPIGRALAEADLPAARALVGRIVGRDTAALDAAGVARAAIESLAESFCDGIVAPVFWLLVGGLPGLWSYKALNTADSLIGHREPRWRAFGWAAARGDDIANLLPARMAGALLCLVAGRGWRVMRRDASRHASPNAGWPEAAMAGALGLRLAGPIAYDAMLHDKAWIGDGRRDAEAADIARALALYRRGCLALWLIAGAAAWAL